MYLILAYCFLMPMEVILRIPAVGNVAGLVGFGIVAQALVTRGRQLSLASVPIPLWLWVGWMALSALWVEDGDGFALRFLFNIKFLVIALAIADWLATNSHRLGRVALAFLLGTLVVSGLVIANARELEDNLVHASLRASAFEEQGPAHVASYLMAALITAYHLVLQQTSRGRAAALAVVSLLLATALVYSGTRSAWVGAVVGVTILSLHSRRRVALAVSLVTVVVLALLFVPSVQRAVVNRMGNAVESGGAGRTDIWAVSIGIWKEHPFLGVGMGELPRAYDRTAIRDAQFDTDERLSHLQHRGSHSIYLHNLAELGVVGAGLFLAWFVLLAVGAWKAARTKIPAAVLAFALYLAFATQGAFLDILNRKYFWFNVALVLAVRTLARRELPGLSPSSADDRPLPPTPEVA